jgi:hypothetical protein
LPNLGWFLQNFVLQKMQAAEKPTRRWFFERSAREGYRLVLRRGVALRVAAGAGFAFDAAVLAELATSVATILLGVDRGADRAIAQFV